MGSACWMSLIVILTIFSGDTGGSQFTRCDAVSRERSLKALPAVRWFDCSEMARHLGSREASGEMGKWCRWRGAGIGSSIHDGLQPGLQSPSDAGRISRFRISS